MKKNKILFSIIATCFVLFSCSKDNKVPCFTTTKNTFDVGEAVAFTNCTKEAEKYLWQFGDGTTSEEVSPSHTFKLAGMYNVSLAIVAPGSLQPLVYTYPILIVNPNMKFDNLDNGTRVRTRTWPIGFNSKDTTITDSAYGGSFNITTFGENSSKVKFFISPERLALGSMSITADVANNQITVPETSKTGDIGGGMGKMTLKDFVAKYEGGKVTITYTLIEVETIGLTSKTYITKFSYSFLK